MPAWISWLNAEQVAVCPLGAHLAAEVTERAQTPEHRVLAEIDTARRIHRTGDSAPAEAIGIATSRCNELIAVAAMLAGVNAAGDRRVLVEIGVVHDLAAPNFTGVGVEVATPGRSTSCSAPAAKNACSAAPRCVRQISPPLLPRCSRSHRPRPPEEILLVVIVALAGMDGRDRQIVVDALEAERAVEVIEAQALRVPAPCTSAPVYDSTRPTLSA